MPLLTLLASNPEAVRQLSIEQIVATAGDGRLRDFSEAQNELREYLRQVNVDALAAYADYCLQHPFNKSGQVLQDIVNELGRRLEYSVQNGRYQGATNAIGYDGIWKDPSGHGIVVEVKTTDAYRLSLETVAKYRDQLVASGGLAYPCSILIIVGRTETGELEAQVRGSRHAWDIRMISIDALINLVRTKESADSQETIAKIRRLLTPLEYTRLDDLVDVVFATTKDVETAVTTDTSPEVLEEDQPHNNFDFTPPHILQGVRERILSSFSEKLDVTLLKKSRALYWDPDHQNRVACSVSKRYANQGSMKYWYAFHPQWNDFLQEGKQGFFILGCTDIEAAFAIPVEVINENLGHFHTSDKKNGSGQYHHIKILEGEDGLFFLQLPKAGSNLPLSSYMFGLKG